MTTDTADTITAYRDGRFAMVPKPEWWAAEDARVFGEPNASVQTTFGSESSSEVLVWVLQEGRGFFVLFTDSVLGHSVWVPTTADYLDLVTTRVRPFVELTVDNPITASLQAISNTLIGLARHGQGSHVDRYGGTNRIDLAADRRG